MEKRVKKALTKTANILAIIIGVFVLLVAVSAIASAAKGYASVFGYTVYAVRSDSMEGDYEDSFNKGALVFVKLLGDDEKSDLEVGQIITFKDWIDVNDDGKLDEVLNTHRIIDVFENNGDVYYQTQGDKAAKLNSDKKEQVDSGDVIGVYSSKINGLGGVVLFIQSPTGFLVTVVVPSALVVIYCAFLLIKNLAEYGKLKRNAEIEKIREELKKEISKEQ